jgi:hypothetical protein
MILGIAGGNNVCCALRQEDVPSHMPFFTFLFGPFLMLSTQSTLLCSYQRTIRHMAHFNLEQLVWAKAIGNSQYSSHVI